MTRHNLDIMRAIAVVTVLIDHATIDMHLQFLGYWDLRWLGIFGVYLFFVHTCLVLMWSLERRPFTLDFYVRRAFRIYPLAMVCVVLALTSGIHFAGGRPTPLGWQILLSNLLLMQNIWVRPNAYGVLWSLPLEVQMYLLLPMLFLFARRERMLWPLLLLWGLACRAAVATYGETFGNGTFAVIPHFLPGVMAYVGYIKRKPVVPAFLFLVFLGLELFYFMRWPHVQRGWIICLALGLALPYFRDFNESLLTRVGATVAKYSYGIYLLHPFALWVGFHGLKLHSVAAQLAVSAVLTAVLAVAAYRWIEEPMIEAGKRVAKRLEEKTVRQDADHALA